MVTGKTALITGAAKRLGRETALALAEQGVHVVVHYRSAEEAALTLVKELKSRGVQAWSIRANLEDPQQATELVENSVSLAGELHFLINNASIFPEDRLKTLVCDDLLQNLKVNAIAPLFLSRAFAAGKGAESIVNFLDSRITEYDSNHASYHLSKRMFFTITRMLALELAPNIRVNAIAPGLILPPEDRDASYLQRLAQDLPMQTHGGPHDITQAVLFLLRSAFITGQVLFVDGGQHMERATYG